MSRRVRVRRGNVTVITSRPRPSDKIISRSPTPTEQRLQQSLPADIRNRPAEEVRAGQSLAGGQSIPLRSGRSSGGSSRRITSVPPQISSVTKSVASRSKAELNRIKLQSLEKARRIANQKKERAESRIRRDQARVNIAEGQRLQSRPGKESLRTKARRSGVLFAGSVSVGIDKTIIGTIALPGTTKKLTKATIKNVKNLPSQNKKLLNQIRKNPELTKKVTKAEAKKLGEKLQKAGKRSVEVIRYTPERAIAIIGTEVLLLKGTGKTLKVAGKVTSPVKKVGVKAIAKGEQVVKGAKVTGKTIKVKTAPLPRNKGKSLGKSTRGRSPKKTRTVTIQKVGTSKRESLAEQVKVKGKVDAVSAQADKLIGVIKRRRLVRKPLPGESQLSRRNKLLLKKFDSGRISKRELIELQRKVPVLERSFFADPKARLRIGRLGVDPNIRDARLRDIIKGNFSIRSKSPQVLIFPGTNIQKFPKSLSKIEDKLKANKPLTKAEAKKLLDFQLKKSGKFKPVGFLSKESEITLAPGEIVKRVKRVGSIEANGKLIPIVQAKVVKATPKTKKLIAKAKKGKITSKEKADLKKRLKKESGGIQSVTSRRVGNKPRLRVRRRSTAVKIRALSKATQGRPKSRSKGTSRVSRVPSRTPRTTLRSPPSRPPRSPPRTLRSPPKSPPRRSPLGRPSKKPPVRPPKTIPRPKRKVRKKTLVKKTTKGYNVFARPLKKNKGEKQPKLIKVNKVPLTKARAEDYRNYLLDTSLARTGSIKPTAGKGTTGKLKVPLGYGSRTKNKFRTTRTVRKQKRKLNKGKVIEKSRRLLDTKQEKKGITLRRRLKQITPKKKKRVKRKKR